MRLPRDVSGRHLAKLLKQRGYTVTRQKGSHMRLTTVTNGTHHVTVPDHESLRIGTLAEILSDVAGHLGHLGISRDALVDELFGDAA